MLFGFPSSFFEPPLYWTFENQTPSKFRLQWGSKFQTSLVFKWSKRGWMPNGLVFECHLITGQPNHLNTKQVDTILFSFMYWLGIWMVGLVHVQMALALSFKYQTLIQFSFLVQISSNVSKSGWLSGIQMVKSHDQAVHSKLIPLSWTYSVFGLPLKPDYK